MNEKVKALIERVYHDQRSNEWFHMRSNMLTASDLGSVLGINSFETPEDVMYKKCGFKKRMRDSSAVDHGIKYENEARDVYSSRYGEVVHEIGLVPHPEHPWLGGSPDGVTESGKLIEIKCPLNRKITDKVPEYYLPQVLVLMEILDLDECDFIQYDPRTVPPTFVLTKVPRDRQWFEEKLPILKSFWESVIERRKYPLCEIRNENCIFVNNEVYQV